MRWLETDALPASIPCGDQEGSRPAPDVHELARSSEILDANKCPPGGFNLARFFAKRDRVGGVFIRSDDCLARRHVCERAVATLQASAHPTRRLSEVLGARPESFGFGDSTFSRSAETRAGSRSRTDRTSPGDGSLCQRTRRPHKELESRNDGQPVKI